jgi:hypothetical protein
VIGSLTVSTASGKRMLQRNLLRLSSFIFLALPIRLQRQVGFVASLGLPIPNGALAAMRNPSDGVGTIEEA